VPDDVELDEDISQFPDLDPALLEKLEQITEGLQYKKFGAPARRRRSGGLKTDPTTGVTVGAWCCHIGDVGPRTPS